MQAVAKGNGGGQDSQYTHCSRHGDGISLRTSRGHAEGQEVVMVDSLACPPSLVMCVKWRSVRRHGWVAKRLDWVMEDFVLRRGLVPIVADSACGAGGRKKNYRQEESSFLVLWYILSGVII